MPIFRYEAADANGKILRGAMDATSVQDVSRRLTERGYQHVRVEGQTDRHGVHLSANPADHARRVPLPSGAVATAAQLRGGAPSPEDIALFFRQMASLLHAGFTIGNALSDLGVRTRHRGLSAAAKAMAQNVVNGASLADEMSRYPTIFAPHVVGLVSAGEQGGFVEFSFEEIALGAEQDAALRQGMWLPIFLWWQSIWSILLFAPMFPSLNLNNLIGSVVTYGRWIMLVCIPLGLLMHLTAWLLGRMRHQPAYRATFDRISLRLPVMANLAKARALAAFTRVLRRLLLSGVSAEPAFAAAVSSVPNAALRERLSPGITVIRNGGGLDEAISATGMFGHDPMQLLITGQKTGQFAEMLDRIASYYQEEAVRATDAAKAAQKRLAWFITVLSTAYVTIGLIIGLMTLGFKYTEGWTE
jgi:type II secretory pathway component PulF